MKKKNSSKTSLLRERVREWTLDGCWISSIEEDPYSYDSEGSRKIRCTIEYDRAYVSSYE